MIQSDQLLGEAPRVWPALKRRVNELIIVITGHGDRARCG